MVGIAPVPCGGCIPCRVNRRRLWTTRQVLESFCHTENTFVTLTYADENLPKTEKGLPTLCPKDVTNWLKRMRKKCSFRYFLVGEYGDKTWRPHYHLSMFGISAADQPVLQKEWKHGYVHAAEFNWETAQYTAGYVVKKLTKPDGTFGGVGLDGRKPEYSRKSNRPGLGATAVPVIAAAILSDAGLEDYANVGDVPRSLNIGRKSVPIGRYLRQKLRDEIGAPESDKQKQVARYYAEKSEDLHRLLADSISAQEALSPSALFARETLGRQIQIKSRYRRQQISRRTL